MPAAACLSFSTEDAAFLETPVGGTKGEAGFAGGALFATGGTGADLAWATDAFGAGVEMFLEDFLGEGVLAIRAKKYHVRKSGKARFRFLCVIVCVAKM